MTSSRRANVRLTPELADTLDALRRVSGKSTTEIMIAAMKDYATAFATQEIKPGDALRKLEEAGFIGSVMAPQNYSSNYKKTLQHSIAKKTRHRSA